MYDSSKGKFVDLSALDVLQIFGRAGRPGMETSGEGYICTTEDKLTHYLDIVTSSVRNASDLVILSYFILFFRCQLSHSMPLSFPFVFFFFSLLM